MDKHRSVLIISSSFGEGHIQVSKAIRDHLNQYGINQIKVLDLLAEAHPYINAVSRFFYLKSTAIAPSVYGWIYYRSQHIGYNGLFYKWLNLLGISRLKKYIDEFHPNIIINTFPFMAMGELRKRRHLSIPIYTIITDFTLHQRWLHTEIDKYYVATEDIMREMERNGIDQEKIKVTGIPVRDMFEQRPSSNKTMMVQMDVQKKYILVMAGAYGVQQNIKEVCQRLLEIQDVETIIVCGKNGKLLKEMETEFGKVDRVHLFGFVERIDELMRGAFCIITKAGGITLAEALVLELPTIIYQPISGQEYDNAMYLRDKGAAIVVNHHDQVKQQVENLLTDSSYRSTMKSSIINIRRKNAAEAIVCDMLGKGVQSGSF